MNKLLKKLAVLFTAVAATVCIAVFAAACNDKEETYATDTFTVTVVDENGDAINGTTFGDNGYGEKQVKLQFCAVQADGNADACLANYQPNVGADGKVTVEVSKISEFVSDSDAVKFVIHVINLNGKGYSATADYGQYEVDKIPSSITITLDKSK